MFQIESKIERALLGHFFSKKHCKHHINEIACILDVDPANLNKKLKNLEKIKLFKSYKRGNQRVYELNKQFPLFFEYESIINKTYGIEDTLKRSLSEIRGIHKVYIFGPYAQNKFNQYSDIELIIIGEHNSCQLAATLKKIGLKVNRKVNSIEISPKDFKKYFGISIFLKRIFRSITQLI